MINFHKSLLLIVVALSFKSMVLIGGASGEELGKAFAGICLSGIGKYVIDELGKNDGVKKFSEKISINPHDVANIVAIAGGLFSLSCITNKGTADKLVALSWQLPIIAALFGITCTKAFQNIAHKIPIIGTCLDCENKHCSGICSQCKLTKFYIATGTTFAANSGISYVRK